MADCYSISEFWISIYLNIILETQDACKVARLNISFYPAGLIQPEYIFNVQAL